MRLCRSESHHGPCEDPAVIAAIDLVRWELSLGN
jgi:hypothetical protein